MKKMILLLLIAIADVIVGMTIVVSAPMANPPYPYIYYIGGILLVVTPIVFLRFFLKE